ncbi:hypothetical protein B296_00013597 [Ensete ventricosum]|uniref:Uncharacterized protein n=1 Tax=Ensete ventricosum TaxID=4639 RepID=A0A426ZHL7_ENSVE|nr:hypothetical protein B296_00013597 [Ensete ventricosum]
MSLSAPYRPASSSASIIIIAAQAHCHCPHLPAIYVPTPFSLSAPYRPASSSTGSIAIAVVALSFRPCTGRVSPNTLSHYCHLPQLLHLPPLSPLLSTAQPCCHLLNNCHCPNIVATAPTRCPLPPLLCYHCPCHCCHPSLRSQRLHCPPPTPAAPLPRCCHLLASMPCHPFYILQWCHSPRCSFNPSSSVVACCRYHPSLISLLALLLNNCCSPHITASRFLLGRYFPYFPLPFPFSVHHSLTLLFIAHHSSIAARTMLSASPSDAPIIVISSLLPRISLMPLLCLYH